MPAADTPAERLGLYLSTLRRHWLTVAVIVAVALAAGTAIARMQPKSYDATAKVLLGQERPVDALLGTTTYSSDPERDLATGVALITLDPIAGGVRRQLRLAETPAQLVAQVTAAVDGNSDVVSITARDGDPARAARIANAFAAGYRAFRGRSAEAAVQDSVAAARSRLAGLPAGADRTALTRELRRLQIAAAFQTGGVQLVRPASVPTAPSSPRPAMGAAIAGLLGLIVAGAMIIVLARTDRRLGTEHDVERAVGRPVLGRVPGGSRRRARVAALEALGMLAMRLTHSSRSPQVVLLTSPGTGEGTAEMTLGLTWAVAELGRRAIAIEADLRRPVFARYLGVPHRAGLLGVLRWNADLDRELIDLQSPEEGGEASVLSAGPLTEQPQPLVAGPSMADVVAEARRRADVVLIAAPPAAVASDALALAAMADAVLLVARLDVTRRDQAARAIAALDGIDVRVLGVAVCAGSPTALAEAATATASAPRPVDGASDLLGSVTASEVVG